MADFTVVEPKPPGFLGHLFYEDTPGEAKPYRTIEDLVFDDGVFDMEVPAGFAYDRASVPKRLRWVVPQEALDYGAVLHDYLYWIGYDRGVADAVFYMVIRAEGKVGRARTTAAWLAVRFAGWLPYRRHKKRRERERAGV